MAGRMAAIRKALISRYHSVALTELPAAECSSSRAFSAPPLPRFPPQLASASRLHSTNITAYPVEPPPDPVPPPVNPPEGYNPPEKEIPDPVTLAEQWQYALSLYSRFSSQAWAMAILTGLSIFGVGWLIKGTNPLHSTAEKGPDHEHHDREKHPSQASE